jgi:hypothetical protein
LLILRNIYLLRNIFERFNQNIYKKYLFRYF